MKEEKVNRWLPCKLAEFEQLDRARTLSERIGEKSRVEAEKARIVREFGEKLKELQGEITRLSVVVAKGEESRSVECIDRFLYSDKKVQTVRTDTNEVVEIRPMYESELQLDLATQEQGEV